MHSVPTRRSSDLMKVIAHQAPGVNQPVCFFTGLTQRLKQKLPVAVVAEDRFAAVTAVHDVVEGGRVLNTNLSGHPGRFPQAMRKVKGKIYHYAGLTRMA